MADSLDGYRGREPMDEEQRMMARAAARMSGDDIEAALRSSKVRDFFDGFVGRYVLDKVVEAETVFLEMAKSSDSVGTEAFVTAHRDYQTATRAMLWLGEVVAEGMEAEAALESALSDGSSNDLRDVGDNA